MESEFSGQVAKGGLDQSEKGDMAAFGAADEGGFSAVIKGRECAGSVGSHFGDLMTCSESKTVSPKVSVVVPVFNGLPYVHQTLDSLLNQSFSDIEIICIDDGSTDETLDYLKTRSQEDDRISVYSQVNHGLPYTRNVGLAFSRGEYVYFMDADDILGLDAIETFVDYATEHCLDIVYCDAQSFYETDELRKKYPSFENAYQRSGTYRQLVYTGIELVSEFVRNGDDYTPVWLSFYRRSFLIESDLWFHEGILHEDNAYLFLCALAAERVGYIDKRLVRRRVHDDSIMTTAASFRNVYGYYACALDVLCALGRATGKNDFARVKYDDIIFAALRLFVSAQREYKKLSQQEKVEASSRRGYKSIYQVVVKPAEAELAKQMQATEIERQRKELLMEQRRVGNLSVLLEEHIAIEERINKKLEAAERELSRAQSRCETLERSRSYRLGRFLTSPYRRLKKLLAGTI